MLVVIGEEFKGYANTDTVAATVQKQPASIIVIVWFIFEEFHHCFKSTESLV